MKSKIIFSLAIVLTLGALALTFAPAFGCALEDASATRCVFLPKAPAEPFAQFTFGTGASPELANTPDGMWLFIDPGANLWYKISDGGLQLTVWVDANAVGNVALAIYAPDQNDWSKPIGRGSFNKFEPHDLFWTGRTRAAGTWYAQVTNNNAVAVPFSLNYSRSKHSVSDRCSSCHGSDIEWDRCVSAPGSNFCEELKNEFNGK